MPPLEQRKCSYNSLNVTSCSARWVFRCSCSLLVRLRWNIENWRNADHYWRPRSSQRAQWRTRRKPYGNRKGLTRRYWLEIASHISRALLLILFPLDAKDTQIREHVQKISTLEDACQDLDGTIGQFRELVLQLQRWPSFLASPWCISHIYTLANSTHCGRKLKTHNMNLRLPHPKLLRWCP